MENIFIEFLPPWIETNLQPAFYDAESGTVLQQMALMYGKVNELTEVVNKYTEDFTTLYNYVHDYFDNLDVQDEINNKLEQMADDGELTEIIAQYLNTKALLCFDTVADMQDATYLEAGSFVKTLGKTTKGDGFGAMYKIDTTGDIQIGTSSLYATAVSDFGGNNYYDISFTKTRANNTTIYITNIPFEDADNEEIPYTLDQANTTPSDYAQTNNTTVTMNGVAWVDGTHRYGSVVSNGEILATVDTTDLPDCYYYVGIKNNRVMASFKANETSAQDLIDNGCNQAFMAYWKLVTNSVAENFTTIGSQLIDGNGVVNNPHPRQAIGQKADKTIVIVTCDGRTALDRGLTSSELADLMIELGCVNAWNLDGGGSTTTVIKGYKINKSIDSDGTAERVHAYTLNVKKQTIDNQLAKAYSNTGKAINDSYNKMLPIVQQATIAEIDSNDIDNLISGQSVKLSNHTVNPPSTPASYYVVTLPHPDPEYTGQYGLQLAFNRQKNDAYVRRKVNGTFLDWQPMFGYYYSAVNDSNFTGTQTHVYEAITLKTKYENIKDGFTQVGNNATFDHFKVKCNADDRFLVSFTVCCKATTTGAKYARIEVDDSQILDTSVNANCESNKTIVLSSTALIPASLVNKTISLKVYGETGDTWIRPKISLKQVIN